MLTAPSDRTPDEKKAERLRSLRKKLTRLNRTPPAHEPEEPPPPAPRIVYRRDLPRAGPRRLATPQGGISIPLQDCVEGREVRAPDGRAFFLVERAVAKPGLAAALGQAAGRLGRLLGCAGEGVVGTELWFLDIETTGLGVALVFLIGALRWREGQLACRQLLARTYAEEAGIIAQFAQDVRHRPPLVTFNGKAFDVPSLRARAAVSGVALPDAPFHFDLLHAARRRFKSVLPDCRLQTLERRVCGRTRTDDIPGHDIGRAYHDFVRTGDARELARVVRHNQADLLTLAELLVKLLC